MDNLELLTLWEWLLILVVAMAAANGFIARAKSRSVLGWIILGLMFNPIAFIVLLFLPSNAIVLASASSPPRASRR